MAENTAIVYSANEMHYYIGEFNSEESKWDYERVAIRKSANPDLPDNTRTIYDGLRKVGGKLTRAENSFEIVAEFQGYNQGLYPYGNHQGLVVKEVIIPERGETPADNTRYYWNWDTNKSQINPGEVDEFDVTLNGDIDDVYKYEPYDNVYWKKAINLSVEVDGEGTVTVDPDQDRYEEGTEVTLTAVAETGYEFLEYLDGETNETIGTLEELNITLDEHKTIIAVFVETT